MWTSEDREAFLETIEESADRLQGLVANLLDASRLRAGVMTAQLTAVGLPEAVALLGRLPPVVRRAQFQPSDQPADARFPQANHGWDDWVKAHSGK